MKPINELLLSPNQLELNEVLTVKYDNNSYDNNDYIITDESGRLMRKGPIARGINEFKLCIVGFKSGVYRLSMGQINGHFTVI